MKLAAMAGSASSYFSTAFLLVLASNLLSFQVMTASGHVANDSDLLQFALNLEFLDAEFFLFGALGKGLDVVSPNLTKGGPPPIGAQKANLDPVVGAIIQEFGYQQVGKIRAITDTVGGIPRPLLDLSRLNFAKLADLAVGVIPPFDPYANTINYLTASYGITYDAMVGYVGTIPNLTSPDPLRLAASLLGAKAGQHAVTRALLYERANERVFPYSLTVADFTNGISEVKNRLAGTGIKDEGLMVPITLGAENKTTSNVLSVDYNSLSYARTPCEILRILYGTGNETLPGAFFPQGANGQIAKTCVVINI